MSAGPAMSRRDRRRDADARVQLVGDPAVCPMWVLTAVATVVVMAAALINLATGGWLDRWWAYALVLALALPALVRHWLSLLVALVALVIGWVAAWPDATPNATWQVALSVLGWHAALAAWLLGANVLPRTVLHRSALRTIGVRWLWIQVCAQALVVVTTLTGALGTDPRVAVVGIIALAALALAVALGLRGRRG